MHDLWVPSMPWWQFLMRAALVYVGLLILIRLSGKRTVGKLTIFDLIVVILIGSSMRRAMLGSDQSLTGAFLVVATLLILSTATAWISARSRGFDRALQGKPVLLAKNGVVFRRALLEQNIPFSDFETAIHKNGCKSIDEVVQAVLEPNGSLTVCKKQP